MIKTVTKTKKIVLPMLSNYGENHDGNDNVDILTKFLRSAVERGMPSTRRIDGFTFASCTGYKFLYERTI